MRSSSPGHNDPENTANTSAAEIQNDTAINKQPVLEVLDISSIVQGKDINWTRSRDIVMIKVPDPSETTNIINRLQVWYRANKGGKAGNFIRKSEYKGQDVIILEKEVFLSHQQTTKSKENFCIAPPNDPETEDLKKCLKSGKSSLSKVVKKVCTNATYKGATVTIGTNATPIISTPPLQPTTTTNEKSPHEKSTFVMQDGPKAANTLNSFMMKDHAGYITTLEITKPQTYTVYDVTPYANSVTPIETKNKFVLFTGTVSEVSRFNKFLQNRFSSQQFNGKATIGKFLKKIEGNPPVILVAKFLIDEYQKKPGKTKFIIHDKEITKQNELPALTAILPSDFASVIKNMHDNIMDYHNESTGANKTIEKHSAELGGDNLEIIDTPVSTNRELKNPDKPEIEKNSSDKHKQTNTKYQSDENVELTFAKINLNFILKDIYQDVANNVEMIAVIANDKNELELLAKSIMKHFPPKEFASKTRPSSFIKLSEKDIYCCLVPKFLLDIYIEKAIFKKRQSLKEMEVELTTDQINEITDIIKNPNSQTPNFATLIKEICTNIVKHASSINKFQTIASSAQQIESEDISQKTKPKKLDNELLQISFKQTQVESKLKVVEPARRYDITRILNEKGITVDEDNEISLIKCHNATALKNLCDTIKRNKLLLAAIGKDDLTKFIRTDYDHHFIIISTKVLNIYLKRTLSDSLQVIEPIDINLQNTITELLNTSGSKESKFSHHVKEILDNMGTSRVILNKLSKGGSQSQPDSTTQIDEVENVDDMKIDVVIATSDLPSVSAHLALSMVPNTIEITSDANVISTQDQPMIEQIAEQNNKEASLKRKHSDIVADAPTDIVEHRKKFRTLRTYWRKRPGAEDKEERDIEYEIDYISNRKISKLSKDKTEFEDEPIEILNPFLDELTSSSFVHQGQNSERPNFFMSTMKRLKLFSNSANTASLDMHKEITEISKAAMKGIATKMYEASFNFLLVSFISSETADIEKMNETKQHFTDAITAYRNGNYTVAINKLKDADRGCDELIKEDFYFNTAIHEQNKCLIANCINDINQSYIDEQQHPPLEITPLIKEHEIKNKKSFNVLLTSFISSETANIIKMNKTKQYFTDALTAYQDDNYTVAIANLINAFRGCDELMAEDHASNAHIHKQNRFLVARYMEYIVMLYTDQQRQLLNVKNYKVMGEKVRQQNETISKNVKAAKQKLVQFNTAQPPSEAEQEQIRLLNEEISASQIELPSKEERIEPLSEMLWTDFSKAKPELSNSLINQAINSKSAQNNKFKYTNTMFTLYAPDKDPTDLRATVSAKVLTEILPKENRDDYLNNLSELIKTHM